MGDHLLRDAHPFLQKLEYEYQHGQHNYLHATYDAYAFYPDFTEDNPLVMIRNAVVSGFNLRPRFPNAIIILTGTLLLSQDELFLPSELDKKVRWIIREISNTISTMKSLVKPKCFTFGEPRIFWVKNFQTAVGDPIPPEHLLKFNNLVRRIAAGKAIYTPVLDLFVSSTARCYDRKSRIIDKSFDEMWLAVSEMIKSIDERDEHYYVNKKVEDRLRELKQEGELKFERKASTYLAVTGQSSFSEHDHQWNCGRRHASQDRHGSRDCTRHDPTKDSHRHRHQDRDRSHGSGHSSSSRHHKRDDYNRRQSR